MPPPEPTTDDPERNAYVDLDAAVFAAYGWPADLADEQILERLVALNAERAAEEARGLVRWLRPEFQCPPGSGVFGGSGASTGQKSHSAKDSRPPAGSAASAEGDAEDSGAERTGSGRRIRGATKKGSGVFGGLKAHGKAESTSAKDSRPRKQPWPKEQAERTKAVQEALAGLTEPASAAGSTPESSFLTPSGEREA